MSTKRPSSAFESGRVYSRLPYRVWHIPQVPGKPFEVEVASLDEARRIAVVLADYDLFQYEQRIKPDYSNAQGITAWNEDEQTYLDDVEDDDER